MVDEAGRFSAGTQPAPWKWADWVRRVQIVEHRKGEMPPIEVLCWIGGDLLRVEAALNQTMRAMVGLGELAHVTLLLDGPLVKSWAPVDYYAPLIRSRTEIISPAPLDLPAALYTMGLFHAQSPWFAFAWPGVIPSANGLRALLDEAGGHLLVYGLLSEADVARPETRLDSWRVVQREQHAYPPELQRPPMPHGWLQMVDGIPMANCLLSARARDEIGGFDHRALLQGHFWWDYVRRLARFHRFHGLAVEPPAVKWAWSDYPFVRPVATDPDIVCRLMSDETRCIDSEDDQCLIVPHDLAHLESDLPTEIATRLRVRVTGWAQRQGLEVTSVARPAAGPVSADAQWPIKVAVLGGVYEPPHNQICFYDFFEQLVGQGYVTWRSVLDRYALGVDLRANDLVILSRPRSNEARVAVDICVQEGIPTLAMFDDNWLVVGKERPEYKELFSPGRPDYENFLRVCRQADLCLFYNPHMALDFSPYCRQQECLPPNVEPKAFEAPEVERRTDAQLLVGYAGSFRHDSSAFLALYRFVSDRDDAAVFIMGHEVPSELSALPSSKVRFVPYEFSYHRYARRLAAMRPDILLAPLGESRSEQSKCPRKFLDASSAGCPGIYSDVDTYRPFVRNGETGLLVEDREDAWYDAIRQLADDPELRQRIAEAASRSVRHEFSCKVLMPEFLRVLQRAISLGQERQR